MSFFQLLLPSPITKALTGILGVSYLFLIVWKSGEGQNMIVESDLAVIPVSFKIPHRAIYAISLLIITIVFFLIQKINHLHRFSEKSTYIMGLFFLFVLSSIPQALFHLFNSISALFMMLSLMTMLNIYNQTSVKGLIFLSSLLISIASLFFFPAILLLIVLYISIVLFRPFELKNIIMVLIAFALPYFYLFGTAYLIDFTISFPTGALINEPKQSSSIIFDNQLKMLSIIGYGSIAIIAIIRSSFQKQHLIVRQRNQLNIILYACLIFVFYLLFYGLEENIVFVLGLSSLFILLFYNNLKSKWLIESLFLILFSISIGSHFFSL